MNLQLTRPVVFFDLETTGLDVNNDRIVEIGLVELQPDGTRRSLVERVDPGIDIPEASTRIHGIHNDEVRGLFGKPRLAKVASQLIEFIGSSDLGGFNCVSYDIPLMLREFERHEIPFDQRGRRVLDVKLIFHAKEAGWARFLMGPRSLGAALRHHCGRELVGAHSAEADVEATIDGLQAQLERYPDLPRDAEGLHDYCTQICEQQRAQARS